jgi:hypothetical protein
MAYPIQIKQRQPALRYANALRCIGQNVQAMELKALEIKTQGDKYIVQLWNKGTSLSMDLEQQYTVEELKRLDTEGRQSARAFRGSSNLLGLSQVLRLAGNYVDKSRGRLIRVSWQDQSDRIQSVTIQYEPLSTARTGPAELQVTTIEELCIHVYKQKKKISAGSEKAAHRPILSASAAG